MTQDDLPADVSYVAVKEASNRAQDALLKRAAELLDEAGLVRTKTIEEGMAMAKISIKLAKEMRKRL